MMRFWLGEVKVLVKCPIRWEVNEDYCKKEVMKKEPYNNGPRLLDIMDTTVLDYLMVTLFVCLCSTSVCSVGSSISV